MLIRRDSPTAFGSRVKLSWGGTGSVCPVALPPTGIGAAGTAGWPQPDAVTPVSTAVQRAWRRVGARDGWLAGMQKDTPGESQRVPIPYVARDATSVAVALSHPGWSGEP